MKETIVLYPAPTFPHLISLVELGKLILHHQPDLSITIILPSFPFDSTTVSSYMNLISQTRVPISFFSLPPLQLPESIQSRAEMMLESIRLNALNALDVLKTLSSATTILALVTSTMHENLNNTHIPTYCYFSSSASALAFFLCLPNFHNQTTKSFKEMNESLNFPGLPTIAASYLPEPVLSRDDPSFHFFLCFANCLLKTKGLIVNTFDLLEASAIKAITDGACAPNDTTPPIFCIGPLITSAKDNYRSSASNCTAWLDAQPSESVVFLCFGRRGVLSEAQIREIAIGLERSNHRFLWVVKSPQGLESDPNLEEVLPQGFLKRTKEKGLILESWAPQNAILSHKSVGGFVTHCGWNSVLEAVSYGVPMMAWPLYAEQHMNSVVLVEEMKLAIAIRERSMVDSRDGEKEGLVSAEQVEKRVRELMALEEDEGKVVRQRSLEMKAMAKAAWSTGGSSLTAFSRLLDSFNH